MKYNKILAIISLIGALVGAVIVYYLTALAPELLTRAIVTVIIGVLGSVGAYLFDQDYRMAIVEYFIAGISVFICIGTYGFLGLVLFVITGIVALFERDKSEGMAKIEDMKYLWIFPVVTILCALFSLY